MRKLGSCSGELLAAAEGGKTAALEWDMWRERMQQHRGGLDLTLCSCSPVQRGSDSLALALRDALLWNPIWRTGLASVRADTICMPKYPPPPRPCSLPLISPVKRVGEASHCLRPGENSNSWREHWLGVKAFLPPSPDQGHGMGRGAWIPS